MAEQILDSGKFNLIKYKRYLRSRHDGKIDVVTDELIFPGSVAAFKKQNPKFAIVSVQTSDDDATFGQEAPQMYNEKLAPLPASLAPLMRNAQTQVTPPQNLQSPPASDVQIREGTDRPQVASTTSTVQQPPLVAAQSQPVIIRDGDAYMKIDNGKYYRLTWETYDESSAPFDRKVRVVQSGDIEVMVWRELKPIDVENGDGER